MSELVVAIFGGIIGLGGAEFRLPILKAAFKLEGRVAIAANLATSLVTLITACAIRLRTAGDVALLDLAAVMVAMAIGGLVGAQLGVRVGARVSVDALERIIGVMLVVLSITLIVESLVRMEPHAVSTLLGVSVTIGGTAGTLSGIVSSMLGVAGGLLIIPT